MSKWIKLSDQMPPDKEYCWLCDIDNDVFEGRFRLSSPDYNSRQFPMPYRPGFCIDEEMGNYIFPEKIVYWMPYFTPEPPRDNE